MLPEQRANRDINQTNPVNTVLEYLNRLSDLNIINQYTRVFAPENSSPEVTIPTDPFPLSINIPQNSSPVTVTEMPSPITVSERRNLQRNNQYRFITNDRISFPIIYNSYGIDALPNLNNLENVVVFPNNTQIINATEIIEYHSGFTQLQCPISLENFEFGQEIRRIKYCGHIFNNNSLMEWFRQNVRCPVCRHDIRDTQSSQVDINDNSENSVFSNIINYNTESDESTIDEEEQEERYEEEEKEQEEKEREEDTINYGNFSNRDYRTNREYIRYLFDSIANENNAPQINNTVNSFFENFNIPFTIDISYNNF